MHVARRVVPSAGTPNFLAILRFCTQYHSVFTCHPTVESLRCPGEPRGGKDLKTDKTLGIFPSVLYPFYTLSGR